ncbi:hypothetical protein NQ318_015020, partial [Aromia moschata]
VRNWAQKLGGELWHFGELVTRRTKVKDDTTVTVEDGDALLRNIHENISNMMKQKVEAVRRIMDIAEQAAKAQKEEDIDYNFQFYNAKNLTNSLENSSTEETTKASDIEPQELRYDDSFISTSRLGERYQAMVQPEEIDGYQQDQDQDSPEEVPSKDDIESVETDEVTDGTEKDPQASQTKPKDKSKLPLYRNRHFYNIPVNTNYSAVHVPSNVYERSKEVISGIIWSEELDKTFKNNYKLDPTLSWQYFGSSTGFMRQFPAMIWSQEPIDLFDCRTRSWYIEAASSPKDVVILVDRSGSMTGMRREIARHVVHNILDTLGNNDYVNIFTFSNTTDALVECFDKKLVQANLANVRLLKESMGTFKTEQIANFSLALITAFELLQDVRLSGKGANCNQAIMLVTDGVQDNYKDIFEKYNWGNLPYYMNVRVFTYLIGREVSDVREVKWMACANQGYYVHLSTYAEVREEVLHYIPVMARPMVLNATQKPNPTWSPVYADVTDPKLTNWLWINRERNRQRERFQAYIKLKHMLSPDTIDRKFVHQQKPKQDNYGDTQTYHLMTSVSLPVYDKKPRQERVANLLGVAGTDIPIEYIQRLMMPYRLGVNGYAFIVTNNGYILTHPDLRPVYQGILKPAYNRVDMIEIEVLDDDSEPREFSDEVREFRRRVVFQEKGNATFKIKTHLDDMRRIMTLTRYYYHVGINGTPFSLVIALPHKYGFNRVQHPVENDIHRMRSNDKIKGSLTQFFTGDWTIHPDWHYCRYLDDREDFENPEEEFLHFLRKIEGPGWKWSKECDRKLICKVVADAKITAWFKQDITNSTKEENGAELVRKIGIVVAFMATHSGLTRWQNFPQNIESPEHEPNFRILHNKAIDEIWYRRAVEQHYVDPSNFVYSVPHEIGNTSNILVTVSHAIFREDAGKKAPAAVVGYQFYHSALNTLFTKITNSCGDMPCKRTCGSGEIHCVMLDDNGFVVISDNLQDTGYFFGKIRSDIMSQLVDEGIYKVTRVYDYQGLCPVTYEAASPASRFLTPIVHLSNIMKWALGTVLYLANVGLGIQFESFPDSIMYTDPNSNDHLFDDHDEYDHEHMVHDNDSPTYVIPKTKPEPCDNEMWLYSLVYYTERNISNSGYNKSMIDCSRPFIVQRVTGSNMILLVINDLCRPDARRVAPNPEPEQVDYNISLSCYRAINNDFPRRLYMSCINKNANESEIKLCGIGTNASPTRLVPLCALLLVLRIFL